MSTKFTLADIHAAADAKYGSFDIELDEERTLVLANPLRLTKAERKALTALSDRDESEPDEKTGATEEDEDATIERMREIIRIAGRRSPLCDELFDALGEDVTLIMTVVESYFEGVQAGEASPSQS